jgi:hypothetical protein
VALRQHLQITAILCVSGHRALTCARRKEVDMFNREEVFPAKLNPSRLGLPRSLMAFACALFLIGAAVEEADAQSTPGPAAPVGSMPSQSTPGISAAPNTPEILAPSRDGASNSFSGTDTNLSPQQLEALVGRVAIYPDDLLGLVLTASTQPLEIVEAQRFLETRETHPAAKPPQTWDVSVIALLNYPDVVKLMDADLTWTQQLGTSVIDQRAALLDAIQSFRKEAYRAGNLRSNDKETVTVSSGDPAQDQEDQGQDETISISPALPQVINVPSYDPGAVVAPAPSYDWSAYDWSPAYPYYGDPNAIFFPGFWDGEIIGFGFDWRVHEIFRGDDHRDRDHFRDDDRDRDHGHGVGWEANGRTHLPPGVAIHGHSIWAPDQRAVRQAQATFSGNLPPGIGIHGRSIWAPDPRVVRQAQASFTARDPAAMRPAVAEAGFGHAASSIVTRPMPQIVHGGARINSPSSVQVFRGTPAIHYGAAMPPHSVAGPRFADAHFGTPMGAPRGGMAASPIHGGVSVGGMVHGGFGGAGGGVAGSFHGGGGHR